MLKFLVLSRNHKLPVFRLLWGKSIYKISPQSTNHSSDVEFRSLCLVSLLSRGHVVHFQYWLTSVM